jgi:hypothetical protein
MNVLSVLKTVKKAQSVKGESEVQWRLSVKVHESGYVLRMEGLPWPIGLLYGRT